LLDRYWEQVSASRSRDTGSDLTIVYTPIHGVAKATLLEVMNRAGHHDVRPVPAQSEPDGTFPTVSFPNPEEPGALDLALEMADETRADLVLANDPDADRLAVVIPVEGAWRPLTGNEIGVLLGEYMLRHDPRPKEAIVASSIVSSPMLGRIAGDFGAIHASTLTGFKWIEKAGLALQERGEGRFIFGYEEALGYSVGGIVRDKDGISAAVLFTDLVADLDDAGETVMDQLHRLWRSYGLWVSTQTSIMGQNGTDALVAAVNRLADDPPAVVGGVDVSGVTDYRSGAEARPPWLGEQALVELELGQLGRILVRPSGTEPKLKVYVDLSDDPGDRPDDRHDELTGMARELGESLAGSLGI
jgi:phosphomannomutase